MYNVQGERTQLEDLAVAVRVLRDILALLEQLSPPLRQISALLVTTVILMLTKFHALMDLTASKLVELVHKMHVAHASLAITAPLRK